MIFKSSQKCWQFYLFGSMEILGKMNLNPTFIKSILARNLIRSIRLETKSSRIF